MNSLITKGVIMKKQLLVATALATTLGVAGVAEAVTATYSGHLRNGVLGKDKDSSTASGSYSATQQASFSVSVSETTDAGTKISGSFDLSNESDGSTDASGLTLTFTDGSKLDLIEAGSAYGTYLATVPGATGEQGVSGYSEVSAPTSLAYAGSNDSVGFEWHSAADFAGVEGLKAGLSAAVGDDGDTTSTSTAELSYSVGLSYVTTTGDTTLTVGGGYFNGDDSNSKSLNSKGQSVAASFSAATGNLTVGAGFATGDFMRSRAGTGQNADEVDDVSVTTAGAKYVSGDITFAIGIVNGDSDDKAVGTTTDSSNDTQESVSASIAYTVASGVSAIIGYKDSTQADEGVTLKTYSGSSWYIGALVSF
jgi:hypothetical protein